MTLVTRRSVLLVSSSLMFMGTIGCARSEAAEPRPGLYRCEGCDAIFERDADTLSASARMHPEGQPGEPLRLTGRVLSADGHRPVPSVIVYAYQTNADGYYADGTSETEWSRRHGNLRGWVRTDAEGRYQFETIKPAPYPGQSFPAHIHLTVLEPGRRPYYIDDVVFEGEFGVTRAYRERMELRGGDGAVRLGRTDEGVWTAERDIILEHHPD